MELKKNSLLIEIVSYVLIFFLTLLIILSIIKIPQIVIKDKAPIEVNNQSFSNMKLRYEQLVKYDENRKKKYLDTVYKKAQNAFNVKNYKKTIEVLSIYENYKPINYPIYVLRAKAYQNMDKTHKAIENYIIALDEFKLSTSDEQKIYIELAKLFKLVQNYDKANLYFKKYLQSSESSVSDLVKENPPFMLDILESYILARNYYKAKLIVDKITNRQNLIPEDERKILQFKIEIELNLQNFEYAYSLI